MSEKEIVNDQEPGAPQPAITQPQQQQQQGADPFIQALMQEFQLSQEQAMRLAQEMPAICNALQQQGVGQQQQQPQQQPPQQQQTAGQAGAVAPPKQFPTLNSRDDILGYTEEDILIAANYFGVHPEEMVDAIMISRGMYDGTTPSDVVLDSELLTDEEQKMLDNYTIDEVASALEFSETLIQNMGYIDKTEWKNMPPLPYSDQQNDLIKWIISRLLPRARATAPTPQRQEPTVWGSLIAPERPAPPNMGGRPLSDPTRIGWRPPERPAPPNMGGRPLSDPTRIGWRPPEPSPFWKTNQRWNRTEEALFKPITQIPFNPFRRQVKYPWLNAAEGDQRLTGTDPDNITLNIESDSIIVEDGKLRAKAVATAAMVQKYRKDGKDRKVLKCPDQLQAAVMYARALPITDEHPPDGIVMSQDQIKGWTSPPVWDEENKRIIVDLEVTDEKLIKKIQDGKTDVSIGFFCDLVEEDGKYNDEEYDGIQKNIVLNHLAAGLDKGRGRCPHGICGIMTSCDHTEDNCGCEKNDAEKEGFDHLPCVGDSHYDWITQDMNKDAKLSTEERKALPDKAFCGPDRSFPVNDCAHYTAALRMLPRYDGPGDRTAIRRCIITKGRKMNCPGAKDMNMDRYDPTEDAAILRRALETKSKPMKAGKYELLPGRPDTHNHYVQLDKSGSGTSTKNDGHTHEVKEFVVQLSDDHSHDLAGTDNKEETPMSDEKKKKDEGEPTPGQEEPKNDAPKGSDKEAPTEEPTKDETNKEAPSPEHTKLVDSIMDFQPPKPREHYEGKTLDALKEVHELLSYAKDSTIPSGSSSAKERAVDSAYAELQRKLETQ